MQNTGSLETAFKKQAVFCRLTNDILRPSNGKIYMKKEPRYDESST